jgi:hypothetical protein
MTSLTQRQMVLISLQSGYRLTPMLALRRFGCLRLGARIYEIKRMGYKIESRMVETERGSKKYVKEYWMGGG